MARAAYDKYDPIAGGFRARLAADLSLTDGAIGPVGVSLDTNGRVVVGTAGQSGLVGILVKNVARGPAYQWDTSVGGAANAFAPVGAKAGDVVDIMTSGDIVNLNETNFPAGSRIYVDAAGDLSVADDQDSIPVGFTVEAGHLIIRLGANLVPVPAP